MLIATAYYYHHPHQNVGRGDSIGLANGLSVVSLSVVGMDSIQPSIRWSISGCVKSMVGSVSTHS